MACRPDPLLTDECVGIQIEKYLECVRLVELVNLHPQKVVTIAMIGMHPLGLHTKSVEITERCRNVIEQNVESSIVLEAAEVGLCIQEQFLRASRYLLI